MKAMAEAIKVGDSVMISGILVEGKDEQFFLKPAMNRDPTAPFNP
jgi:tartrate dehydratase beta subunit/fumarate hydratase class I family protein